MSERERLRGTKCALSRAWVCTSERGSTTLAVTSAQIKQLEKFIRMQYRATLCVFHRDHQITILLSDFCVSAIIYFFIARLCMQTHCRVPMPVSHRPTHDCDR